MSAVALAGFAVLLVIVFGVRELIHRRRAGESSWRRPPTRAAWIGDGTFGAGVVGALAAPALDLVDGLAPIEAIDRLGVQVVGAAVLAGGGLIAIVAQSQMGASWRAGIDLTADDALVRHGLFRAVRNPFYLGIILAVTGVVLLAPNLVAVGAWIAVVLGCEIDVRLVEEPHLAAMAGRSYREYAATTGRFVPWIGRGSSSVVCEDDRP